MKQISPLFHTLLFRKRDSDIGLQLTEEEREVKFTPEYKAKEPVFWHVFKEELSKNNNELMVYDLHHSILHSALMQQFGK